MISSNICPKFLHASLSPLFSQGGCGDARILEEPRKSRKSRSSGGLENAFSVKKSERKGKRGERKNGERRDRMGQKMPGKGELLRKFSRGNQVISRGTPTTHFLAITVLFTDGKNDYLVTTMGMSHVATGSSKKREKT